MLPSSEKPTPITTPALDAAPGIGHGFFTRSGGVSAGLYKGLNVGIGSNDDPQSVRANRARVAESFGLAPDKLVSPHQVHSADAVIVDHPFGPERPRADAVVTKTPGLLLGILTADCGPVLFADSRNRIIGAAHAGWQGAVNGILESTVEAMETLGAQRDDIVAVLGPTISQKNYEVGPEFVARLTSLDADNNRWLVPSEKPDHAMFNLPGYIVRRLANFGVSAQWTGHCTYGDEDSFFSYRRTTHRREPDYGRQISAICIH